MNPDICQIYAITPPVIKDEAAFLKILDKTLGAAPKNQPVACLQIRLKNLEETPLIRLARSITHIAHKHQTLVLMNDDPAIAKKIGADGAHIGQNDMDYFSSRQLLGKDAIIGVTCHNSKELAFSAANAGADYVAFGAFYETQTKAAKTRADLEILTWWNQNIEIPCVAIGGINLSNAAEIISAGADFIAVSSGIWDHPQGPDMAIKELSKLCAEHSPPRSS